MGMIIQNGKLFSGEPKTTYKERVLWNGPATPSSSGTDITLTDAISNYDEIVFKLDKYNNTYAGENIFIVSLLTIGEQYISTVYTGSYQGAFWDYLSDTSIKIRAISDSVKQTYVKIIGIKYGDTVKRKDYHVYSTEEQIVGEWIDGSTLYEKTIYKSSITLAMSSVTAVEDLTSLNIDTFVGSNTAKFVVDGNLTITDGLMGIHYNSTTKKLNVQQRYSDRNITGELSITIRYTKTSS